MPAIPVAASLSLPTHLSPPSAESSAEMTNPTADAPTQRPVIANRCRTRPHSSTGLDLRFPPPPRYSSLAGALPPIRTDIASAFDASAALAAPNLLPEDDGEPMMPPRYSSVFQTRSRGDRDRQRERRRSQPAQGGSESIRGHGFSDRGNGSPASCSGPQLHEYHLRNGPAAKTQPWATLKVYSRSSASSLTAAALAAAGPLSSSPSAQRIPRYTTGELVSGSLDLNLETPLNVNSINLSLRGRIITSSYEGGSYTFLEEPITSWTRNNGDPRSMSFSPVSETDEAGSGSPVSSRSTKKFEGKLSGTYSWPFAFPFPKVISLSTPASQGGSSQSASPTGSASAGTSSEAEQTQASYPTPQTFSERETKGSVQYELVLRMTHGLLRSVSKLYVHVAYVPDITPAPASSLRQLAYAERTNVPGPDIDPVGWLTLASVLVRGKLYAERSVKLRCTLSLANPQSYTRGTVIPCHICIESSDSQALDALASPKTIAVRLIRRIQYYEDGGCAQTTSVSQGKQKMVVSSLVSSPDSKSARHVVEDTMEMEKAVWWVNPDVGEHEPKKRRLEGEIHLEKELQASCPFALFKVSYTVELFPFETSVFAVSRSGSSTAALRNLDTYAPKALISHPVTIATLHGEGHTAIPFTKPKVRSSKKKQANRHPSPSSPSTMAVMGVSAYL